MYALHLLAACAFAQTPLTADGQFNKIAGPLEQVFQFTLDGARLKVDRPKWGAVVPNANPNVFNNNHPLEKIFNQIRTTSGVFSSSMSVGNNERESRFQGKTISGRLRMAEPAFRLDLEEAVGPQRVIELSDDGKGGIRLMFTHPDGDMILFNQSRKGAFTISAIIEGKPVIANGESFLAMYKNHKSLADSQVLPVLESLKIRLLLSPYTPEVRKSVLALVTRTPETIQEGQKLITDLDSDKFAVREKATRQLNEQFAIYKDLIQTKVKDTTLSAESAARLSKILDAHPDSVRVDQVVAALDLPNDPTYLVELLDGTTGADRASVIARLEKATDQRLGDDIAGWKAWLKNAKK